MAKKITIEELLSLGLSPEQAQAVVAKANEHAPRAITFKVSAKGGVSVYGLGRFPVSLYLSQWEALLGKVDDLKAFIEANRSQLKVKEQADATAEAAPETK